MAFSNWTARMECRHPAVAYLGWLLADAGARVVDAAGTACSTAVLLRDVAAPCEPSPAPWRLTLVAPDGRASYTVAFTGIDRPGWESAGDAAAWGWGGLAAMTGEADGPPLAPGAPLASMCAALHALIAFASARVGGCSSMAVEIALGDVVASLIEVYGLRYAADGTVRRRNGDWWGMAGWGLYHCRDGAVSVALRDRVQLATLMAVLGLPPLAEREYPDFLWGLCADVDELNARLVSGFIDRGVDEVVAGLRRARIAVAPVRSLDGLLSDRHLRVRKTFQRVEGMWLPRFPARGVDPARTAAPDLTTSGGAARPDARPLAGVRVIDLSTVWAGPMAARMLADLGATVVKLERPGAQAGRFSTGLAWDRNLYAILNDRNKETYACDLQDDGDRQAVVRLVAGADVLIENFIPRNLDRLGFGHAELHRINPRLIIVAMPAMGLTGPDAESAGYGSTIEQAAGLGWLYADGAGEPHRSGINFSDPIAGLWATIGALLALVGPRERTVVEISQQEAALSLMAPTLVAHQEHGPLPRAVEAQHDGAGWAFPIDGEGVDACVPVRAIPEVVGSPAIPGAPVFRWTPHPDGRSYPLVTLPWRGAFSAAVTPGISVMPGPMPLEPGDTPGRRKQTGRDADYVILNGPE